jgi:alkylation response protein AidB-like acyl-CoA dehydrogenase
MDFELDDDERALGESVRAICASRFPLERLQALSADQSPDPYDETGWKSLAEAGVFSLQVPEDAGGVGLGMGASSVVFEELGRALVPGPLVATHLAARDLDLPGAMGTTQGGSLTAGTLPVPTNDDRPEVAPLLVPHLGILDALVVVGSEGLSLVDPGRVESEEIARPLDPLTRLWRVEELPQAKPLADAAAAGRWLRDETILTAALLVGIASRCVDMAVSYAKEREQFGRPIGSFQAIKHICADMLVRSEIARVAVQAAAVSVDQPGVDDSERAAAVSAMLAVDAAVANAKACIQVHGGMGFTWEVPAHLFLMRAKTLAAGLRSTGEMAEAVAEGY